MPITAVLIPAADCVLLLHQFVIGPVTVHLMYWLEKFKEIFYER